MAEVGVADLANNLYAPHAMSMVWAFLNHVWLQGLKITWPAAARIEFAIRGKQGSVAANAGVDTQLMVIPKAAREGAFGGSMAGHIVFDLA